MKKIMIEEFLKQRFTISMLHLKSVSDILSYSNPNSFRNKFSNHGLNLKDILTMSEMTDLKLCLKDSEDKTVFTFDSADYLSTDEMNRLKAFICDLKTKNAAKIHFNDWLSKQPQIKELCFDTDISSFNLSAGNSTLDSNNFYHSYLIIGLDHKQASDFLKENLINADAAQEYSAICLAKKTYRIAIFTVNNYS